MKKKNQKESESTVLQIRYVIWLCNNTHTRDLTLDRGVEEKGTVVPVTLEKKNKK